MLNSHSVKELDIVNKKKLEYAERLKKPTNSVQQRLKDACTRDYKVQPFVPVQYPVDVVNRESKQHELIKKEINSPPFSPKVQPFVPVQYPVDVVNRESKQHKLIKKEINSPPFSPKDDPNRLIDLFNKVKSKRNWKQYEIPKQVDKDGYFKAIITDFSKGKLGGQSYIVSPVDLKDQYLAHLRQLQQVYKSTVVESLSRDKIEKNDLVVALIGITWHRATVLEVDDKMVVVRSIETGCNCFIKDFSKIKAPLPSELQKKAFIIEVTFENDYSIDINSIVSIKILSDMSETILATMKLDNEVIEIEDSDSDAFEDELVEKIEAISRGPEKRNVLIDFEETKLTKVSATSLDAKCKSIDERKYLNSQMIKDFHTGDNIKLTFLDGSELTKGIAHFCELNAENVDFYLKIGNLKNSKFCSSN